MKFSAVTHKNNKEIGRSEGLEYEKALDLVKKINRSNQDHKAYVEETHSVKHLPITVKNGSS
jgi:hypothetical protein